MPHPDGCEALLIGGRSGAGKTSAGWEVSSLLRAARISHCLVEGDNLDQAFPAPPGDPARAKLTEANLAALWRNYATLGYRRLIYTNTVAVVEPSLIIRAMGGTPRMTAVLLTASDATVRVRLSAREIGSQLGAHLASSATMARQLETTAPPSVIRIATDSRNITDIAHDIIAATGWSAHPPWTSNHEV